MRHVILTLIAGVLGLLAASTASAGFWTGLFVGAVMATSGKKWFLHLLAQAKKEQAMKEAQASAREAVLMKRVEKMEAERAMASTVVQQPLPPVPPPPPQSQATVIGAPHRQNVAIPNEPELNWPALDKGIFAMPPN